MGHIEFIRKAAGRISDAFVERAWRRLGIAPERIGYDVGFGPLTRARAKAHRALTRRIHIAFVEAPPFGRSLGPFMTFWVNERSRDCTASLNERIEEADALWVFDQDPIPKAGLEAIERTLARKKPGAVVVNPPAAYNLYHESEGFRRMASAGVRAPRFEFGASDVGRTEVVYKMESRQTAPKFKAPYRGPVEGYRPFEFFDVRDPDGLCRRYRLFWILGAAWPWSILVSLHWNATDKNLFRLEYDWTPRPDEIDGVRRISEALGMGFFSVDCLRPPAGGPPIFTDVNIYTNVFLRRELNRRPRDFGRWHIFDTRARFGLKEPLGRSPWDLFDEGMCALTGR
ncbi:MAG: hypothetical protein AAB215_09305 [Planctomycetota bacterium]